MAGVSELAQDVNALGPGEAELQHQLLKHGRPSLLVEALIDAQADALGGRTVDHRGEG
jgi:hypothetical protein